MGKADYRTAPGAGLCKTGHKGWRVLMKEWGAKLEREGGEVWREFLSWQVDGTQESACPVGAVPHAVGG